MEPGPRGGGRRVGTAIKTGVKGDRRGLRLSCRLREHIQVEQIFLSHFDGAEKEDGFCDDNADQFYQRCSPL